MVRVGAGATGVRSAGTKGGARFGTDVARRARTDIPAADRHWLRGNGIDWDGIAG